MKKLLLHPVCITARILNPILDKSDAVRVFVIVSMLDVQSQFQLLRSFSNFFEKQSANFESK